MVDVEQPIRPDSKAAEEMYRVMFTTFIIVFFNPDHGPYCESDIAKALGSSYR